MSDRKIKILYQEMADLTLQKCSKECRVPLSCCSQEYCEFTLEYAKEKWNIELKETGHPKLPLMGPNGCTAAPHLRPLCAVHVCEQHLCNSQFNKKYFKLRDELNQIDTHLNES